MLFPVSLIEAGEEISYPTDPETREYNFEVKTLFNAKVSGYFHHFLVKSTSECAVFKVFYLNNIE